jgi:hypothetical protein
MKSRSTVSSLLVTLFIGVAACTPTDQPFGPSSPDDPSNPPAIANFDFGNVPDLAGFTLYSLDAFSSALRVLDPVKGTMIGMPKTVTLDGEPIVGGNGLATQPGSNQLFALVRMLGQDERLLVTIDPATGDATLVGNTQDRFASLAFSCSGVLYGVTGRQPLSRPPGVLYSLNTSDASQTESFSLPFGASGGRALAFNADDELMYYLTLNDTEQDVLLSVDLETGEQVDVPKGNFIGEPTAAVFVSEDVMLAASAFFELYTVSLDGAVSNPESMDHRSKGLALVPSFCEGAVEVLIDIKPGSDRNPVNTKSNGVLPVAILTTDAFDAATVNPATVTIGDGEGDETGVAVRKNGTLMANLEDVDDDGDLDMILHFNTQDIVAAGDLDEDTTSLTLNGLTVDDQAIVGSDAVSVVH